MSNRRRSNLFNSDLRVLAATQTQYRLCPKSSEPLESCFQLMPLAFVGDTTTIRMNNPEMRAKVPDFQIPAMDTNIGTKPAGSYWRRNPLPACNCDLGFMCGTNKSNATTSYWIDPDAKNSTPSCPTGTQFAPPHPAIYGYGTYYQLPIPGEEFDESELGKGNPLPTYSFVDKVRVPEQKGDYILSFRWDW